MCWESIGAHRCFNTCDGSITLQLPFPNCSSISLVQAPGHTSEKYVNGCQRCLSMVPTTSTLICSKTHVLIPLPNNAGISTTSPNPPQNFNTMASTTVDGLLTISKKHNVWIINNNRTKRRRKIENDIPLRFFLLPSFNFDHFIITHVFSPSSPICKS